MGYIEKILVVVAALVALPGAASAASTQNNSLLIAGTEISGHRSTYGQVGLITPLPGSQLGNGWVARGIVYGTTYKYDSNGRNIDGDVVGGELTAGYQKASGPGWWAFYTGPTYRHTELSPNDPSSDADGGNVGWIVIGEGERNFTKNFKVNLSGNYTFASNDEFWTRLRLLYRVDGELYAGPEAVYQGDGDYSAWQLGAGLFGFALDENTMLGVKAGVRKVEDLSASPYGGLEIGYRF